MYLFGLGGRAPMRVTSETKFHHLGIPRSQLSGSVRSSTPIDNIPERGKKQTSKQASAGVPCFDTKVRIDRFQRRSI